MVMRMALFPSLLLADRSRDYYFCKGRRSDMENIVYYSFRHDYKALVSKAVVHCA